MKELFTLLALLWMGLYAPAQQGFTFNRISTDDGIGLASNVVYCTYQDKKRFYMGGYSQRAAKI